jgi:hypothetical protein
MLRAHIYRCCNYESFYMNNIMHDVWYQYGFDEASGNFKRIIMDLGK